MLDDNFMVLVEKLTHLKTEKKCMYSSYRRKAQGPYERISTQITVLKINFNVLSIKHFRNFLNILKC